MDLNRLIAIALKRKRLLIIGVFAGIIFALFSLYRINFNMLDHSKPMFYCAARTNDRYTTTVNLIIDNPGFGLGRADGGYEKGIFLAPTYSYLAISDVILEQVEKRVGKLEKGMIMSEPIEDRPIFKIIAEGTNPSFIKKAAKTTAEEFIKYLKQKQRENDVPRSDRVVVNILGDPTEPVKLKSRKIEIALLLFMLPVAITFGLILLLENMASGKMAIGETKRMKTRISSEQPEDGQSMNIETEPEPGMEGDI
jgi:hypothetical protein